jgi:HK97 family phage major capsid protein
MAHRSTLFLAALMAPRAERDPLAGGAFMRIPAQHRIKTMIATQAQEAAVKRHAVDFLTETRSRSLADVEPHKMTWAELCAAEKRTKSIASRLIDEAEKQPDGPVVDRMMEANDALMAALDAFKIEKDIRTELNNREPRERPESPKMLAKRPGIEAVTVNPDGTNGEARERDYALAPQERMTSWARGRVGSTYGGLTTGAYLRAMITGAQTELERRALSEGSDSAGGFTVPTELSAEMIDALRAASVVSRAGARTVPIGSDNLSFAKVATDPVPAWRNEAAAIADSDPTFARVELVPRSLAVLVKVSRELLMDSINLQTELPRILAAAMAVELDRAALEGTGIAPQPRGIRETVGIGTTAIAGAPDFDHLIDAHTGIMTANAGPVSAIIAHPRDAGTLAKLKYGDGHYIGNAPALANVPMLTTTGIAINRGSGTDESTIYAGNFAHLMIGIREQITVEVIRELYAANGQYAMIAHLRADIAVGHPGGFHTLTGVTV